MLNYQNLLIGGGLYDYKKGSESQGQIKIGKWIESSEGFNECQVQQFELLAGVKLQIKAFIKMVRNQEDGNLVQEELWRCEYLVNQLVADQMILSNKTMAQFQLKLENGLN
ncbi:unnamed protein product [Paramecium sonneborni]|uniref:Uncharacterized protein n=1 Tax=Paramecium sonneborni TaxID=65129 RepID=A0A8S1Q2W4_9CILI|nr:unnamed protein product [Paramecium sonneborni]